MTDNTVNLLGLNAQVSSSSLAPKVKKSSASTGGGETSCILSVTAETWRYVKVHFSLSILLTYFHLSFLLQSLRLHGPHSRTVEASAFALHGGHLIPIVINNMPHVDYCANPQGLKLDP